MPVNMEKQGALQIYILISTNLILERTTALLVLHTNKL